MRRKPFELADTLAPDRLLLKTSKFSQNKIRCSKPTLFSKHARTAVIMETVAR